MHAKYKQDARARQKCSECTEQRTRALSTAAPTAARRTARSSAPAAPRCYAARPTAACRSPSSPPARRCCASPCRCAPPRPAAAPSSRRAAAAAAPCAARRRAAWPRRRPHDLHQPLELLVAHHAGRHGGGKAGREQAGPEAEVQQANCAVRAVRARCVCSERVGRGREQHGSGHRWRGARRLEHVGVQLAKAAVMLMHRPVRQAQPRSLPPPGRRSPDTATALVQRGRSMRRRCMGKELHWMEGGPSVLRTSCGEGTGGRNTDFTLGLSMQGLLGGRKVETGGQRTPGAAVTSCVCNCSAQRRPEAHPPARPTSLITCSCAPQSRQAPNVSPPPPPPPPPPLAFSCGGAPPNTIAETSCSSTWDWCLVRGER